MFSSANCKSDLPPWLHFAVNWVWKNRESICRFAVMCALAVGGGGMLAFKFSPTDLERADADVKKAEDVINSLEKQAMQQRENAIANKKRAAEIRKILEERKDSRDTVWLEWCEAIADSCTRLQNAEFARRDNLFRLTTQYRRLVAEAECEILRAKDARDRGTPYFVAPRVQELLAPLLAAR